MLARSLTITVLLLCGTSAFAEYEYALDDGTGNWSIGPSEWDAELLWGNYFETAAGYETIVSISVSFGSGVPLGEEVTFVLFEDPNDDFDPTDAVPLAQTTGLTVAAEPNEFIEFDIVDTAVSGGFFVGATMFLPQSEQGPRMDPDTQLDRSWLFFDSEIDLTDLGGSPLYYQMSQTPFNGTWMVRAQAVPEPTTLVTLLLLVGVAARRR